MNKKFVFILLNIVLSSCAMKPIQYQAKKGASPAFDVGYAETHIKKNIYNVEFLGNGYNKPATVRKFFLKRSGEVATNKGFKGFCIIKDAPKNGGWEGKAVWYGHAGDVKLTNQIKGDSCFSSSEVK